MSKNMQVILGLLVVLALVMLYVQSRVASTFGNQGNVDPGYVTGAPPSVPAVVRHK